MMEITPAVARQAHEQLTLPLLTVAGSCVVLGPNGSGKTLLSRYVGGGVALQSGGVCIPGVSRAETITVEFRDLYHVGSGAQDNYYQKRWQATEVETSPLVRDILGEQRIANNAGLIERLHLHTLLDKRAIQLSSGEARKMTLLRALMRHPRVLVVDNPFIGLDAESRVVVADLLRLIGQQGVTVVLLVAHPKDVPDHFGELLYLQRRELLTHEPERLFDDPNLPFELPARARNYGDHEVSIRMRQVTVAYEGLQLVSGVDWEVRRGDKWALLGRNGSGKSTLLSLVTADNPQGYANDIELFGRRRGSGESIWDIKRRIGYISPDVHSFYQANVTCLQAVCSGFFDSIGLYRKPNEEQVALARRWMACFHCDHLAERPFLQVSYGEQRLVLLVRVFVKSPDLLILDEPLHGLDAGKKALAKRVIEEYANDPIVTLIYVTHYREELPDCITKTKELKPCR